MISSPRGLKLRFWQRLTLAGICLGLIGGFTLATQVTPDSRGFGTHQQFGLPPCSFQIMFSLPCPSCGGTTSFAHFVRGEWGQSIRSNVGAFLLALVCLFSIPWTACSAWQGRLLQIQSPVPVLLGVLVTISGAAGIQWLQRLLSETF